MRRCLSEKTLVLLHSGEGAANDRAHLECCLSCARRYRQLSSELGEIVTALKQPAPASSARRRFTYSGLPYSGLRWSLAAAAIVLAFVGGRLTVPGVADQDLVGAEQAWDPDSSGQLEPAIQSVLANGIHAPGSYGLYIDNLLTQDESDQNLVVADGNEEADAGEL